MVTGCAAKPSLPAATTTTMPLFQASSTAYDSGSSAADWVDSVPNDRLSTRMFRPGSLRCATTQSMAAITWETSVAPSAVATLRLIRCAPGATPANRAVPVTLAGSWPAMMPAMWVPCP